MLRTVKDHAHRLNINPSTLYAWAAQGKIPWVKIHGLLRFRQDLIEQWVASFEQPVSPCPTRPPRPAFDHELGPLIAAAKRAAYTGRRGKTRPTLRPIKKEETDGAV